MVSVGGRSARGFVAAAAVAMVAAFQVGLGPAPVAAAGTGLAYSSVGTWTVDPSVGRIHVDLRVTAASNVAQSSSRRYYFPGLQLTLPPSTTGFASTDQKGNAMPVAVTAVVPSGVIIDVTFSQRLYAGQSTSFDLQFDVVDAGGPTDRDLRIGQDLLSFPIRGFGSPATPGSSARVIFPAGYVVQEQFGSLTSQTDPIGDTIFSSGPVPDASALNAWFTATRNVPATDYLVSTLALGPIQVTLRYWSDDSGWADQVARVLDLGYPIVRTLIGLGDPSATKLTIQEVTTQGIGGFSGEYDPASSLVQVSYFADPLVILHEITHLWFNDDLASDRWIDEGFASYYAEQAVIQLGLPDRAPTLGPSLMAAAEPLNSWSASETPGSATEAYLYGASLEVAREIAKLAGLGGLQHVWAQAEAHTSAYASAANGYRDLPVGGVTDWRRLLDYLEQTTGRSYAPIWQQWVVTAAQAQQLNARASARADYSATASEAGGWTMPPDVRGAMGGWQFAAAGILLDRTRDVLALKQEIAADAPASDTVPPSNLQQAFESKGTAGAAAEANLELQALDAIAGAQLARAQSEGAARVVGLIGTDPDAALNDARAAFDRGDSSQAISLADSARAAWIGAIGVGQLRILGTVAGSGGVLLLIALYIWARSGRRRRAGVDGGRVEGAPHEPPRRADA